MPGRDALNKAELDEVRRNPAMLSLDAANPEIVSFCLSRG